MEHEHTVEAIGERLAAGPRHNYLRDWIYGGIDGSVTTFAVVTGVVGAQLSPVVIVIMGFANLVGDGFSMAVVPSFRAQPNNHGIPDGSAEGVRTSDGKAAESSTDF